VKTLGQLFELTGKGKLEKIARYYDRRTATADRNVGRLGRGKKGIHGKMYGKALDHAINMGDRGDRADVLIQQRDAASDLRKAKRKLNTAKGWADIQRFKTRYRDELA
jgi:hypothetical protein